VQSLAVATGFSSEQVRERIAIGKDAYAVTENAHAVAILTEWDEFKRLDYDRLQQAMLKPAFIFDGRNMLWDKPDGKAHPGVYGIGKPLPAAR
jgi:UDPglucose 6-dehydrogenase